MKNTIIIVLMTVTALTAAGCQKAYTCECKNPGGVGDIYELKETPAKAKSICDKHNEDADSIPWSETHCELK